LLLRIKWIYYGRSFYTCV